MSEPKFTPGSWVLIADDDSDPDKTLVTTQNRINNSKVEIATINTGYVGEIGEEQEANIHLISAAPDMYSLLSEILEGMENYNMEALYKTASSDIEYLLSKARGEL